MSIITYIKETQSEMKHVNWPTRKDAIMFTGAVIAISAFIAYFLGMFDTLFSFVLQKLLLK